MKKIKIELTLPELVKIASIVQDYTGYLRGRNNEKATTQADWLDSVIERILHQVSADK